MVAPPETTYTSESTVACDGGQLGHPRVFLNLGEKKQADCPYCGHRYLLQPDRQAASPGH